MKSLLNALQEWCTKYPLKEKIVVVDSYFTGEQINQAYNLKGNYTINLKFKTVYELASETVDLHSNSTKTVLEPIVAEQIIYSLLMDLKVNGSLTYFADLEITPSFSKAINSTIMQLRLAGYTTKNFPYSSFINSSKGNDLYEVLQKYEEFLKKDNLFDTAELLTSAIHYAQKRENSVFMLQSNLSLTYLEEKLLINILPENTQKLPLDEVRGIQLPEKTSIQSISWGQASPLSYIYDLDHAVGTPKLSFFVAKTEELEIKGVLEKIKSSKSKLDENIIFYTNSTNYVTLLYHLAQATNIPITFGEGLPVSFSRPGRLVSGLLSWIQSNYSVKSFLELIQEGLLDLGDDTPSKTKISSYLRELQIGWGKERYISQIQKEVNSLTFLLEELEDGEKKDYLNQRLIDFMWLEKWFHRVFKQLPNFDGTMNYQKCLKGISYLLKHHCTSKSLLDEVGKTTVVETIDKVSPFADETRSSFEVFQKVKDLLLSIRINQSKPKPGHIHVSSYKSGVYNNRRNVFIVGLNNRDFPGTVSEDPLLLDRERRLLNRNLPLLQNTGQENLYTMLQLLAHSTGVVTVSYSNFDIGNNRAVSPAHLFLQCFRLATGKKDANFKDIKMLPSPLTASEIVDNKDYWNQQLNDDSPKSIAPSFWNFYKNIENGLESERRRQALEFNEYDGLVHLEPTELDPRTNRDKRVSAAKLETLAKCPYSYFLQDVLRVRPIENVEFNANKWLDAATRGSLLHAIFESFYKEIGNEKPSVEQHEEKILSIAKRLIAEQKEMIPPPNERIFDKEVKDILECSMIFLKEEEAHGKSYNPLYFEYTFGLGEHEPAVITLSSGETIQVSGKIDRVDEANEGHFHIIDYKTGSTYAYRNKEIFKGGRQLQHLLYALAIEQHLNLESGKVQESAYYFPTVKGMAERVVRKQDDVVRANGVDILERLVDVLKTGTFTMTDNEEDCKFCDFQSVCRRKFYDKDILEAKQMDQTKEVLKRFKGVRAYE